MEMDLQESIANQTRFALKLSSHVGRTFAADANLAFSPISLHAILSIIAVGANGPTRDQIVSFVGSKSVGDLTDLWSHVVGIVLAARSGRGGPRIGFVNGLWVDKSVSVKEGFKELATKSFKAEVKGADFQGKAIEVTDEVNSWVENASGGLIKELLPSESVDSSTRLVLCNALYFNGVWRTKFDPAVTKDSEFFLLDGTRVQVPFMTSKDDWFISSYDDFAVLKLPYGGGKGEDRRLFSMYMFLPHAKDGLWNLWEKLSCSKPGFLDHHLPRQYTSVKDFKIPKFKIPFGFEASQLLEGMGLVLPFSEGGDLMEMVDSTAGSNLHVSSIFHKSFVEVDEEGTVAAGASAALGYGCCLLSTSLDFVADHPFVFVIREDATGVVLFTGHVLNPLLSG